MSHVNQVIGKRFVSWSQDMTTPGIFTKKNLKLLLKQLLGGRMDPMRLFLLVLLIRRTKRIS